MDAFLQDATQEVKVAVERNEGKISVWKTCIHGTQELAEADYRYLERYVKFLLWSVGGFRVYLCGRRPPVPADAGGICLDGDGKG